MSVDTVDAVELDLADLAGGPVDRPVLTIPFITVLYSDGRVDQVQARNPDMIRYEDTAARHKWPGIDKGTFRWLTFLAWAALRREGRLTGDVTFDAFMNSTDQVSAEAVPVPPTGPGPAPG